MFPDLLAVREPDRVGRIIQTEETILLECWAVEERILGILLDKPADQALVLDGPTTRIERTTLRV
jgi:hypothetical protein